MVNGIICYSLYAKDQTITHLSTTSDLCPRLAAYPLSPFSLSRLLRNAYRLPMRRIDQLTNPPPAAMLNFVVRLIKKLNMACHLQVCQQQTYQDFLDMGDP